MKAQGRVLALRALTEGRRGISWARARAKFGILGGTKPISDNWGFDRGAPIDRYYISRFLSAHRSDIRGRALEVMDSGYLREFGSAVDKFEVLDIDPENANATVVADLASAEHLQDDQFDCFVLTQTLQLILETRRAIFHSRRILRRGGVLLVTVPTSSRIVPGFGLEGDYWRFTPASCRRLFMDEFGADHVEVTSYGNVFANIAFLAGLAQEEIDLSKLDDHDEYFPLITAVRAVK